MSDGKLFGVAGRPILHSQSPELFRAAFTSCSMQAGYLRLHSASAREAVRLALDLELTGFNVTSPFKEEVLAQIASADDAARIIGAVNTVVWADGRYHGCNTDGTGLTAALAGHGIDPAGQKAVVLGAGGAGKAAAWGVLGRGARDVVVANRSKQRSLTAAARLGCRSCGLDNVAIEVQTADILVSCLPPGADVVKPDWLHEGLAVVDADYTDSRLEAKARAAGCHFIGGRDWLVGQAVAGFEILTRRTISPSLMLAGLQKGANTPDKKNRIALIGFMGAGKSRVGGLLADKLRWEFVDTDRVVEAATGMQVHEIFANTGEARFRELEKTALRQSLQSDNTVVACGGGALGDPESRRLVVERCTVVWLWASMDVILTRVLDGTRPLLGVDDPASRARELLDSRRSVYGTAADLVVGTDNQSPDEVAGRIEDEFRRTLKG